MTASTDWQQGVNWMTKASVASTCGLLRPPWHFNIKEPPFFSSMWAALPAPSRIDEQEQVEERRERESWVSTHLPSSTIRWRLGGPETPTGNLSPRHTILSRSALSDVSTPAPASKEVSRYQATKWKWTAPSKSSRERTLCFYSFYLLRSKKNSK